MWTPPCFDAGRSAKGWWPRSGARRRAGDCRLRPDLLPIIIANTTLGAATGGAAGGLVGSQLGDGVGNAFSTLGGVLIGGLGGTAAEHAIKDTTGYEYIVRRRTATCCRSRRKTKRRWRSASGSS
jgi:uncharacterized protein YcfJ